MPGSNEKTLLWERTVTDRDICKRSDGPPGIGPAYPNSSESMSHAAFWDQAEMNWHSSSCIATAVGQEDIRVLVAQRVLHRFPDSREHDHNSPSFCSALKPNLLGICFLSCESFPFRRFSPTTTHGLRTSN